MAAEVLATGKVGWNESEELLQDKGGNPVKFFSGLALYGLNRSSFTVRECRFMVFETDFQFCRLRPERFEGIDIMVREISSMADTSPEGIGIFFYSESGVSYFESVSIRIT